MSEESKFNFSEEQAKSQTEKKDEAVKQSKETVKKDAVSFIESTKTFFKELLDFRHDTDRDATIEAIKADIPFKGATAWILICSIFVASVGLNANSTAVVIGAMLISPLMGPILGIGMSIAINDIDTLKKSLINLAVMIILSLLTAYLFFKFFPLHEDSSELLARTKPDIRDVLIAFFGGLALIIARTKKGTIASVIFGVAIATALMPPLCTVGFGLAKGGEYGFKYATGAMYLFTINTIFIALATFIVLKVLRFPMLKYANSKKRKRIAQLASILAILVMIPAVMTFIDVYKQSKFENQIARFIENEIEGNDALNLLDHDKDYDDKIFELNFLNEITEATKQDLLNEIKNNPIYPDLRDVALKLKGNDTKSYELISNAYKDTREELKKSKNIIAGLQKEISELQEEVTNLNKQLEQKTNVKTGISFTALAKDAKIRFKDLEFFSYAKMLESKDFIKVDTVSVARLKWNTALSDSLKTIKEKELSQWLKQTVKTKKDIVIKRE
ncbi:DUF389 domain-containing protein [uncultured Lacinutrix sp.]|uniref:DUF389 domain-containing protein n=1 Tax=uncultured Lacinutrix sp. TaxID=574032 RepID=UPI00262AD691|nr:DUF389 domain-containing protein [uncultured Lacinutrix sp.]